MRWRSVARLALTKAQREDPLKSPSGALGHSTPGGCRQEMFEGVIGVLVAEILATL